MGVIIGSYAVAWFVASDARHELPGGRRAPE